jgi:hypothetical protein
MVGWLLFLEQLYTKGGGRVKRDWGFARELEHEKGERRLEGEQNIVYF